MKNLLGGKGANLAEMVKLGLPVPQGFIISTEACTRYYKDGNVICPEIISEIERNIAELEEMTGKKYGDAANPLLLSVRSGSRSSMPGMMDTILNLGINDEVVKGLENITNNPRFAYDSYRRFIQIFSDVVTDVPKSHFERIIDEIKDAKGVKNDLDLNADDLKEMAVHFKEYYKTQKGSDFPQDVKNQLLAAIKAVFNSWNNQRAVVYRKMHGIPADWGTAVNIQEMVFGNSGETSGSGVAFTRDPTTGEKKLYGEFLFNAQGDDIVSGIRTPCKIEHLKDVMPEIYDQFNNIARKLESHYRDMQDLEFTIENKKLYILQTRNGKRTTQATVKIAVDLVNEGIIDKKQAILNVDLKQLNALQHTTFSEVALRNSPVLTSGLAASPGASSGKAFFTSNAAVQATKNGESVILIRIDTSSEDIEGMSAAKGILTARGGMTAHAAVLAREMGRCCVVNCGEIKINEDEGYCMIGTHKINEGDYISIDGSSGHVYEGVLEMVDAHLNGDYGTFMSWVNEFSCCNGLNVAKN